MFRIALIALALALASCVSGQLQRANNFPRQPDAIICTVSGAPERTIQVPAGRSPTDFCPEADITFRLYHMRPGIPFHLPSFYGGAPPLLVKDTGGTH